MDKMGKSLIYEFAI